MLTTTDQKAYAISVEAKSLTRISILNRSACALTRSAFFSPIVYGGLYRGTSVRRSLVGYANSVQSAALLFSINGGSSLTNQRTPPCLIYISYIFYAAYPLACLSILLTAWSILRKSWGWIMNNVYSLATGKPLQDQSRQDFIESIRLKFGLQKEIRTRRKHAVKRGPWSDPHNPFRKWHKRSDHVLARYPDYQINARYDYEGAY